MSVFFITPGKNQRYAHYLMGFGAGIFLGGVIGVGSGKFPIITTVFGLVIMLLAGVVSWMAKEKE